MKSILEGTSSPVLGNSRVNRYENCSLWQHKKVFLKGLVLPPSDQSTPLNVTLEITSRGSLKFAKF